MKFNLIFLMLIMFVSCGEGEDASGDCYVSPEPDVICSEIYEPVVLVITWYTVILVKQNLLEIYLGNLQIYKVERSVNIKIYKRIFNQLF